MIGVERVNPFSAGTVNKLFICNGHKIHNKGIQMNQKELHDDFKLKKTSSWFIQKYFSVERVKVDGNYFDLANGV